MLSQSVGLSWVAIVALWWLPTLSERGARRDRAKGRVLCLCPPACPPRRVSPIEPQHYSSTPHPLRPCISARLHHPQSAAHFAALKSQRRERGGMAASQTLFFTFSLRWLWLAESARLACCCCSSTSRRKRHASASLRRLSNAFGPSLWSTIASRCEGSLRALSSSSALRLGQAMSNSERTERSVPLGAPLSKASKTVSHPAFDTQAGRQAGKAIGSAELASSLRR